MPATFVWLDLETTGLDPKTREIIALGLVVTDEKLQERARFEGFCVCPLQAHKALVNGYAVRGYPNDKEWDPIALKMHLETGVYDLCRASEQDWSSLSAEAGGFLQAQHLDPKTTFFAGSSVHFDTAFLREHAPHLLDFASYRMLDVSVFKVLAQAWGIEDTRGKTTPAHTPLKDLEGSMADLRHWVRAFGMLELAQVPAELLP